MCRLELQTRNNGKLMVALEELLERLDLPEDTQELLEQTEFEDAKWELFLLAVPRPFIEVSFVPTSTANHLSEH